MVRNLSGCKRSAGARTTKGTVWAALPLSLIAVLIVWIRSRVKASPVSESASSFSSSSYAISSGTRRRWPLDSAEGLASHLSGEQDQLLEHVKDRLDAAV